MKKEFGSREPPLADLMGMLRNAIATIPRVPTYVDALEEALPKYLPELLKSLRDIGRKSPTGNLLGNCVLTKLTEHLGDQGNLSPRPSSQQKHLPKESLPQILFGGLVLWFYCLDWFRRCAGASGMRLVKYIIQKESLRAEEPESSAKGSDNRRL